MRETEADGPHAQKGIFLGWPLQVGKLLVAAHIERANDQGLALHFGGDREQGLSLLVLRGGRVAIEKKKLGAEKPDAFRAAMERGLDLGSIPDVGEDFQLMTVQRGGGERTKLLLLLFAPLFLGLMVFKFGQKVSVGIEPDFSGRTIKGNLIGQMEIDLVKDRTRLDDGGYAETLEQDGTMGGRAAVEEDDAMHQLWIKGGEWKRT